MEKKQILLERYSGMLRRIDQAVALFQEQDLYNGIRIHRQLIQDLSALMSDGAHRHELQEAVFSLMGYQEAGDYNGIADVYELRVRKICAGAIEELHGQGIWPELKDYYADNYRTASPGIRRVLDSIRAETEDIPDGYELVETQVGTYALRITQPDCPRKLLLTCTGNPIQAAERLVTAIRGEDWRQVVVLGFEMGYTAAAFSEQEDLLEITVYEPDRFVLKAAFHYMDLHALLSTGRLSLIYDPALKQFAGRLAGDVAHEAVGLVIHQPSVKNIADTALRDQVENFLLQENTVRSQKRKLAGNFYRNTTAQALEGVCPAECLKEIFCGRNMLLLAGGPSLEQGLLRLQEAAAKRHLTVMDKTGVHVEKCGGYIPADTVLNGQQDNDLVVCVGTVLNRVLAAGIHPDFVVMTDAQENMTDQIAGVDTQALSLIYLPTLYAEVVGRWKGRKYLALQKGFEPSEKLAQKQGRMLFETGGSVSTLALDLGLRFGCRRIVCMGLDLAYTGGRFHAGDRETTGAGSAGLQVESVQGKKVQTGRNLNQYRHWIEQRLARRSETERKTQLLNLSNGARIKGMENKCNEDLYHHT